MFVISGFCLLFGWMLFLAESLSSLWKYSFLVRTHCNVYVRGYQPFWNRKLLFGTDSCEGLPVWYTHFWNKNLLNLSSIMLSVSFIKLKIFINVKTLIMFMLLSEQARGRPTRSVRTTWCPREPCWWPLVYIINSLLAANCMCSWEPYLFHCKRRLINFFIISCGLQSGRLTFLFLYLIETYKWRSVFPWLRFVDQTLRSHSIFSASRANPSQEELW